jgi:hypothetical protein
MLHPSREESRPTFPDAQGDTFDCTGFRGVDRCRMNQIVIRTNKGEYIAGETVYGCVYLNIVKPIASKGMKLKVKGLEKCEWEYSYTEREDEGFVTKHGEMKGKKEFFKVEIRLIDYPG